MIRNTINPMNKTTSSFLSCEKDAELIIKRLFVENRPYSDLLKRLVVIHTKDCIDNLTEESYKKKLQEMTVSKLIEDGYISLSPRVKFHEHEEVKTYILISFDNFTPNENNPQFRDCMVVFDILCNTDYWDIGNYRLRPLKIAGYIDGILNNTKLTGIGKFLFMGCSELVFDDTLAGYTLSFWAIHGSDDEIEAKEEE